MGFLKDIGKGALSMGKSTINGAVATARGAIMETGRAALHATAPDDYEYYLCSFELFNSSFNKIGFISFVVMPNQLVENYTPIQVITKTHGGIVTVFNSSFNPIDITLAGTFGRKFRIVTGLTDPLEGSVNQASNLGLNLLFGKVNNAVSGGVMGAKSGYGLTKVLQHILSASHDVDELGRPNILVFNNYAFNTHYVVDVINYSFQQSYEQNMIWNYSINLKAVGFKPHAISNSMSDFLSNIAANSISNGVNNLISKMTGQMTSNISQGVVNNFGGSSYLNTII